MSRVVASNSCMGRNKGSPKEEVSDFVARRVRFKSEFHSRYSYITSIRGGPVLILAEFVSFIVVVCAFFYDLSHVSKILNNPIPNYPRQQFYDYTFVRRVTHDYFL